MIFLPAIAVSVHCSPGASTHVSGAAHGAPYVLLWSTQRNLKEYDAGEWPSPTQILRRATVDDNDSAAVIVHCDGQQIRVRVIKGRAKGTTGWVNHDDLVP